MDNVIKVLRWIYLTLVTFHYLSYIYNVCIGEKRWSQQLHEILKFFSVFDDNIFFNCICNFRVYSVVSSSYYLMHSLLWIFSLLACIWLLCEGERILYIHSNLIWHLRGVLKQMKHCYKVKWLYNLCYMHLNYYFGTFNTYGNALIAAYIYPCSRYTNTHYNWKDL